MSRVISFVTLLIIAIVCNMAASEEIKFTNKVQPMATDCYLENIIDGTEGKLYTLK